MRRCTIHARRRARSTHTPRSITRTARCARDALVIDAMRCRTAAQLLICVLARALTPPSIVRRRRAPVVYSEEPALPEPALPEPAPQLAGPDASGLPEPVDEFDDLSDLLEDDDDLLEEEPDAAPGRFNKYLWFR